MPIASNSITKDLLGPAATKPLVNEWFTRHTASLMLGAAVGGIFLGAAGDRFGRTRAMAASILFYSVFAGLGAWVTSPWQLCALRFFVGLGVGGMWPNGVALVSECWPSASKPLVSGVLGAGINLGVLALGLVAQRYPVTPDSWRWIFYFCAAPTVLGLFVLAAVPESPAWLASRREAPARSAASSPLAALFAPDLRSIALLAIALGAVPLVGAWAAGKWMLPWADEAGAAAGRPEYKALAQSIWGAGATLGSLAGAPLAAAFGRRRSYGLMCLGATVVTVGLFTLTRPLSPAFLPFVFGQGFVSTLLFGWLPLHLPALFPTAVRASGTGLAFNTGRFATAVGVFASAALVRLFEGDQARIGAVTGFFYALGIFLAFALPRDSGAK
jgi:MFS family permease